MGLMLSMQAESAMNEYFWLFVFMVSFCGMSAAVGAKKDYWGWFFLPAFIAMIFFNLIT